MMITVDHGIVFVGDPGSYKGGWNRDAPTCAYGHEYTEENTYVWTDVNGYEHRTCRQCKREQAKARRSKRDLT